MSAAPTPARRLLALLEDEQALETRPLDDILADLSAHGVDPAGPIRLARRLAGPSEGPAAALLGAVIEDEAAAAEIAALETADVEDVRGRLEAGTVAAVAAEAKRRAGGRSNVVGLRRRRGAAWAWAGSLVGMAACVLIVVAVWWPAGEGIAPTPEFAAIEAAPPTGDGPPADAAEAARLPEVARAARPASPAVDADPPAAPEPQPQSTRTPALARRAIEPEPALRTAPPDDRAEAAGAPDAAVSAGLSEQRRTDRVSAPTVPLPPHRPDLAASNGPAADAPADALAALAADPAPALQEAAEMPPEIADTLESPATVGDLDRRSEAGGRGLAVMSPMTNAEGGVAAVGIVALVVVDPRIMPAQGLPAPAADGRAQASPDAALAGRLAEARALAGGRHLAALATVRQGAETYDAAIVLRDPAAAVPPAGARDPLLVAMYGPRAGAFEIIRLPPRP